MFYISAVILKMEVLPDGYTELSLVFFFFFFFFFALQSSGRQITWVIWRVRGQNYSRNRGGEGRFITLRTLHSPEFSHQIIQVAL